MKVTILAVDCTDKLSNCWVEFSTPYGNGRAFWDGSPPKIDHSYAVELEIAEILTWGTQIVEVQNKHTGITYQDNKLSLLGRLEANDPDGVVFVRLGTTLLMLETAGKPAAPGSFVQIHPPKLVLFPYDAFGKEPIQIETRTMTSLSNRLPSSTLGDQIFPPPTISQPSEIFMLGTYRQFLDRVKAHQQDVFQLRQLQREYFQRLPRYLLAVCPYCGVLLQQPVDSFSFMGYHPALNLHHYYRRLNLDWEYPRVSQCQHWLLSLPFVNLHGKMPDDLPPWAVERAWSPHQFLLESAPNLIVWPLLARQTSAVIHALPMGRLDDLAPMHHNTIYFVSYFVGSNSNLYTDEMWVPTDRGSPASGGVEIDTNLVKWVRAGRVFWLDPMDDYQLVQKSLESFPYANVQPQGWYEVLKGGRIEGPKPYYRVWQDHPPSHDQSFPKTIE